MLTTAGHDTRKEKNQLAQGGIRLEALEDRLLLTGNVLVQAMCGGKTLRVVGDALANNIVIDQAGLPAGQLRFSSTDGTTINGQSGPVTFTGVRGGMRLSMGNGDDSVVVNSAAVPGNFWMDGGAGANTLTLNHAAMTDSPALMNVNTLQLSNQTSVGGLNLLTGRGDTSVSLDDAAVTGGMTVWTQGGFHTLTVLNGSTVGSAKVFNGSGGSSTVVQGATLGNFALVNGAGSSTFISDGSSVNGNMSIDNRWSTSSSTTIAGETALNGKLTITGSGGADLVQLIDMQAKGACSISTGTGNDILSMDAVTMGGAMNVSAGSGDDVVDLQTQAMAAGASCVFSGPVSIDAAAGNDVICAGAAALTTPQATFMGRTVFDGGSGTNMDGVTGNSNTYSTPPVLRNLTAGTLPPTPPILNLSTASDTGLVGDGVAAAGVVTLVGHTDPNTAVTLSHTGDTTTSDETGAFQFNQVPLAEGANTFTAQATGATGKVSSFQISIHGVASAQTGDMVLNWNQVLLNVIGADKTAPPLAARNMAIVSIAVYDSLNAIDGVKGLYVNGVTAPAGASAEAAVAEAAYTTLESLFPTNKATFDAALASSLATLPEGTSVTDGQSVGQQVAQAILAMRASDGANQVVNYVPGSGPGVWVPTPPAYGAAVLPQWPYVTPFVMSSGSKFRLAGPPALTSDQYASELNTVETLGAANSTVRTADQTQIANFWSDGGGTYTPPGHWNNIADQIAKTRGFSLDENARMLALLNIGEADAGIAAWDDKYFYNRWRPITAIRQADTDGNPNTVANPTWTPLLATPAFPSYVSGHSTFSGAAATILSSFFGANTSFTATSESLPGVTRSYTSFDQASQEAGMSRIYGGIHFPIDDVDGRATGTSIGNLVLTTFSNVN